VILIRTSVAIWFQSKVAQMECKIGLKLTLTVVARTVEALAHAVQITEPVVSITIAKVVYAFPTSPFQMSAQAANV
jgi:hypothetical protein